MSAVKLLFLSESRSPVWQYMGHSNVYWYDNMRLKHDKLCMIILCSCISDDDDDDDHLSSECRIYRLQGLSQFESIRFPVGVRISVISLNRIKLRAVKYSKFE